MFTQVTDQHQTVAADGSDRTPQGQTLAENGRNRLEEKGLVQDGSDRTRWGRPLPLMVQIALQVSVQHKSPDLSNCRKERKVLQVLTFRTFPVHELGTNSGLRTPL